MELYHLLGNLNRQDMESNSGQKKAAKHRLDSLIPLDLTCLHF